MSSEFSESALQQAKQKIAILNPAQSAELKIFESETRMRKLISEQFQAVFKREKESKSVISDLVKLTEKQNEQILNLQTEIKSLNKRAENYDTLFKKISDVDETLRCEIAKYAEELITVKSNSETMRIEIDRKLIQMIELDKNSSILKENIGKYSSLLYSHKTQIDERIAEMSNKIENFIIEIKQKLSSTESLCQTINNKEDTRIKKLANLQASIEILNNIASENKKSITQIRQSKADIPLIREVEKMWNEQLQSALYRIDNIYKEVSEYNVKSFNKMREIIDRNAIQQKVELMAEIKIFFDEAMKTIVKQQEKPMSCATSRKQSLNKSIEKTDTHIKTESKCDENKEENNNNKEDKKLIENNENLNAFEYFDGEMIMNEANEKYFTLHSGDSLRKRSYSPLPSYKKAYNIKMMIQGEVQNNNFEPKSPIQAQKTIDSRNLQIIKTENSETYFFQANNKLRKVRRKQWIQK